MDDRSRIAVSLETGVQNYALVFALCALSFTGCDRTRTMAFPLVSLSL